MFIESCLRKTLCIHRIYSHLFTQVINRSGTFKCSSVNYTSSCYSSLKGFDSLTFRRKPSNEGMPYVGKMLKGLHPTYCSDFLIKHLSTTEVLFKKKKKGKITKAVVKDEEESAVEIDDSILHDPHFNDLRSKSDILGFIGAQETSQFDMGVMVVQPWVKWGPQMKQMTSPQMMLDEAAALVATLPGVRVVHKEIVPVRNIETKTIFGAGTLERLVSSVRSSSKTTAIFISIDLMKNIQLEALQSSFGLQVMDRYAVVLGIFRHHAKSREAKLQVALAELPYIKKRLDYYGEKERMMMMDREKSLRKVLDSIASNRALIRQNRLKSDLPTVSIVGYTNSGKTSLIHAITGDDRAQGKDQLFATLDVTAHGGRLPCGLQVLFIDTVGFIQDIPTDLIASFRSTLEDAICADIVVHIRDASHPDYDVQGITVENTLSSLPLPEKTPVITVANKVDLGRAKSEEDYVGAHQVSCMTGQGLEDLMLDIEEKILKVTGRQFWRFNLPTGSDEIRWLRNATGLVSQDIDIENPQVTTVISVMTEQEVAAFKRNFRKKR